MRKFAWPDRLLLLLLFGYLSLGRSFAYVGISPLFVGELSLGAFLIFQPMAFLQSWIKGLMRVDPLNGISWFMFAWLGFGFVETLHGLHAGHDAKVTLQCFAFNFYGLFFFVGVWVGLRHPHLMSRIVRPLAWFHGIYGLAYLIVLSRVGSFFGQPWGAAVCILMLLSYERKLARVWLPILLNTFVMLGLQVRAEWLGLALCLPLLGALTGRLTHLMQVSLVLIALLGVGLISDFKMPAPGSRGGEISTRHLVGRGIAAVDEKAAEQFTSDAATYASTTSWRTSWWQAIWDDVHRGPVSSLVGFGYGYPIWDLHPEGLDEKIRTPHNAFVFALAYTGWVGLCMFCGLQLCFASLLWRAYRITGNAFGICYWVMIMAWSFFDNFMESPFGAIPFYLLIGLSVAQIVATSSSSEKSQHGVSEKEHSH